MIGVIECVIFVLLEYFILYYLYTKAEENGMNGFLWLLAGLFFGVFALAVFLFITWDMENARRRRNLADAGEKILERKQHPVIPYWDPATETGPEFHDVELDKLIEQKRFDDARKHLLNLLRVAGEMGDKQTVENYLRYNKKLSDAEKAQDGWLNMNP